MKRCTRCHQPYRLDDKYCAECGFNLHNGDSDVDAGMTRMDVGLSDIRFNLGMVYFKRNNLKEAIQIWENVLKENPEHVDANSMIDEAKLKLSTVGDYVE